MNTSVCVLFFEVCNDCYINGLNAIFDACIPRDCDVSHHSFLHSVLKRSNRVLAYKKIEVAILRMYKIPPYLITSIASVTALPFMDHPAFSAIPIPTSVKPKAPIAMTPPMLFTILFFVYFNVWVKLKKLPVPVNKIFIKDNFSQLFIGNKGI